MLITLGVGSIVAIYTVTIEFAYNNLEGKVLKSRVTAIILLIGFLFGLVYVTPGGQQILQLVDFFTSSFVLIVLGILESFSSKHMISIHEAHLNILQLKLDISPYCIFYSFNFSRLRVRRK